MKKCDFLIIGSGLAGLAYALKVADQGEVILISKTSLPNTNTSMAQGGIAAVMDPEDSYENHIRDTLTAGAGLCHPDIVRCIVESAPERIQDLLDWGVQFDSGESNNKSTAHNKNLDLTREGGHSHRRILHVQDHTGEAIHRQLLDLVRSHPRILILEDHLAVDLILNSDYEPFSIARSRCLGALILDKKNQRLLQTFSRWTMLATGGAGKVYLYTSNWSGATGDGIAMAARAGARIANLEFMQFHPTCLYHPDARNFLITEAMRGEGAELVNSSGESFVQRFHPLGSLAPRDIVARAIDAEIKKSGAPCVYLDISHKPTSFIRERFPVIHEKCLQFGIDITQQPIPVVPAAHYLCGGVVTNINGQTDIEGLLAAGETACTGLHGANRLASNSLLECLVIAHRAALYSLQNKDAYPAPSFDNQVHQLPEASAEHADEMIVITHIWEEIRRLMWNYVGIVRSDRRLQRAQARLVNIQHEIEEYYGSFRIHPDIIELRNIALVAEMTVQCALLRKESRGIHFNIDWPLSLSGCQPTDTILINSLQSGRQVSWQNQNRYTEQSLDSC